jgi:hypothetical protein
VARAARLVALAGLLGLMAARPAPAQSSAGQPASLPEYSVKAAFLYNIAKFVTWPASAFKGRDAPLVICVLGKDPFGKNLDLVIQGKNVAGRPLLGRRLSEPPEPGTCSMLFISSSENGRLEAVMEKLRGSPVLTVGETEDFAAAGGMIRFVTVDKRVSFEINVDAARRSALGVSSKLLGLGKVTKDREVSSP